METEKLVLTPQIASFLMDRGTAGPRDPMDRGIRPPGAEHCAMQHEVSCVNLHCEVSAH